MAHLRDLQAGPENNLKVEAVHLGAVVMTMMTTIDVSTDSPGLKGLAGAVEGTRVEHLNHTTEIERRESGRGATTMTETSAEIDATSVDASAVSAPPDLSSSTITANGTTTIIACSTLNASITLGQETVIGLSTTNTEIASMKSTNTMIK